MERSMNASDVSDDIVTRLGASSICFVTFFILFPPKISDLAVKPHSQCLVPGETLEFSKD
jgi:hypothetical protein